MKKQVNRKGEHNPNWKGGICSLSTANDILDLSADVIKELKKRIINNSRCDPKTKCWIWTGSIFTINNRPRFILGRKSLTAYRVSYVLHKGFIHNSCIIHTCDNPSCVNPKHLLDATNAENSKDMVNKQRSAWGEKNNGAKLTAKQVLSIRKSFTKGSKPCQLAEQYGVHVATIKEIIKRKTWVHL